MSINAQAEKDAIQNVISNAGKAQKGVRFKMVPLEKKIEKEEQKERSIEEEKATSQDEVVRTFEHQIRAKITTISNNTRSIGEIISKHGLKELRFHSAIDFEELKKATKSQILNPSLGDYLAIVDRDHRHLQKELAFVKEVMNFKLKPEQIKKLRIKKFFLKWAENQKKRGENKVGIIITGQDPEVEFSPDAFISLCEQFYNNTLAHGVSENHFKVDMFLSVINLEKIVVIEFRNNGESMKIEFEDFKELFGKRNKSNGSGIGGNYIYRIVKAHKGEIFPIKEVSGFGFRIELPKRRNYED